MKLTIKPLKKFSPIVTSDKRWNIIHGGRGSGKSLQMADLFITKTLADYQDRLCTRPVQKSIKDSVHKIIAKRIKHYNLSDYFEIQNNYIKRRGGGTFHFVGMNDLRSLEGLQDAWIEEAQDATQEQIIELEPTIRNEGAKIYATYNPKRDDDYIHVLANDDAFEDVRTVVQMNWSDNQFFPDVLNESRIRMKVFNLDLHNHIWEGEILRQISGSIIKPHWFGRYDELPTLKRSIIVADTASEAKEQSDYTVFLFGGLGLNNKIYLIDLWRGKVEAPERIQKALDFWNRHKWATGYGVGAKEFKIEKAQSGFDLIQHLRHKAKVSGITRKKGIRGFEAKFSRLMDVFAEFAVSEEDAANGHQRVFVPSKSIIYNNRLVTNAYWVDEFITECQSFTAEDEHDHDDQVDCCIDIISELSINQNQTKVIEALYQ